MVDVRIELACTQKPLAHGLILLLHLASNKANGKKCQIYSTINSKILKYFSVVMFDGQGGHIFHYDINF